MFIAFEIRNFRGIVKLSGEPKGKSLKIKGDNGAGKSSAVDAFYWGLGGNLEAEVIRNGEDKAETEIEFADYLIVRKQSRGKKPSLLVKSRDGKTTYNSPATLLAGLKESIDRQTFSHRTPKEQAAILRKLCPTLDTSALDAEHDAMYAERTEVNRIAKMYAAQAEGITVTQAPDGVEDDEDIAAIANKKTEAETKRSVNDQFRQDYRYADLAAAKAAERVAECKADLDRAKAALLTAEKDLHTADERLKVCKETVERIVEPDTSAIDAEIKAAKDMNTNRAAMRAAIDRAKQQKNQRSQLKDKAREHEKKSDELTKGIDAIKKTKAQMLAAAKLPIEGLAIVGDTVTLMQDGGAVEIPALNTATRIRLDVAIAAACGHKCAAIRDASLLGKEAKVIEKFAREHGVQLIEEIVVLGQEALTAEIVEDTP